MNQKKDSFKDKKYILKKHDIANESRNNSSYKKSRKIIIIYDDDRSSNANIEDQSHLSMDKIYKMIN